MDVLIERCAGLDVHQATVTACVRMSGPGQTRTQVLQTFGATTPDLLALRDWLTAHRVTHVAMESTGVYWKPVYYTLEPDFTLSCAINRAGSRRQFQLVFVMQASKN
jgi:transposase